MNEVKDFGTAAFGNNTGTACVYNAGLRTHLTYVTKTDVFSHVFWL